MAEVTTKPVLPAEVQSKWQRIVTILANTLKVPAGLIMRVHPEEIEVFISSQTEKNPYTPGEKASLHTGLYCETVMKNRAKLLVPDALKDPVWDHNPDISLNMTYYQGFPLVWPNGEIFGTICVLDNHDNIEATAYSDLMNEFKGIAESDLALVWKEMQLQEKMKELEGFNSILLERESRIIEIKEEINRLCKEIGREIPYPEIWNG